MCNGYPFGKGAIAAAEDPSESLFTEDFIFVGGSFLVFPGVVAEATFILRHISKGLFLCGEQFEDAVFLTKARRLMSAVLALSNEVASRARLVRAMKPIPAFREDVLVPDAKSLRELKRAATFTSRELADLLRQHKTDAAVLETLTTPLGSVCLDDYSIWSGPLLPKPIVRAGNDIVVALPGMLLAAAWNEVIRLAHDRGIVRDVVTRYSAAVWDSVVQSLAFLEHSLLPISLPTCEAVPDLRDGVFTLDTDKVMYVVLVTDALAEYDPKLPFGEWRIQGFNTKLAERIREIEELLLGEAYFNEVLILLIYQGMGRSLAMPMAPPRVSPFLMMTAADLETISVLEAGDQLLLWKFAHAGTKVRHETQVVAFSTLDEFNLYRARGYSYYVSDDGKPDLLHIATDGALALREELAARRDFRGVASYNDGFLAEVTTLHGTRDVPIYVPKDSVSHGQGEYVAVLVEGLPLPVWIVSGKYKNEEDQALHHLYAQFSDAIAYWLWQFSTSIRDIVRPLASEHRQILIQLRIQPDEFWERIPTGASAEEDFAVEVVADRMNARLTVTLRSALTAWLRGPDNRGERLLMVKLLNGLRNLLSSPSARQLDDAAISAILDRHAPLGQKKKLLFIDTSTNPILDPRGLPEPRKVKLADENLLLDELGEYLGFTPASEPVGIPDDERTQILQRVVTFYYDELQRLVASLSSDFLLEHLIAQHEALLRKQALQDLLIPTRIECFTSEAELSKELQKEIPSISKAGLASRFVIEYVVAQPPSGIRPISLSVYDRLQALASGLLDFGFESDLIHNRLADIKLWLLPSGRIGADRDDHRRAMGAFLPVFSSGEIFRAKENFEKHWTRRGSDSGAPPEMKDIDAATKAELGFSLTEIIDAMRETLAIGEGNGKATVTMPLADFVRTLSGKLAWSEAKAADMISLVSLSPRADFLQPPKPFRKEDVFPWRYNRSFSYIRRPLLRRQRNGVEEILWGPRFVILSARHLISLVRYGRFPARSSAMKKLMGEFNFERGELFNDEVAKVFQGTSSFRVKTRVKKIRGPNGWLRVPGDIDVLVAQPTKRRLLVVECKDLAVGRAPHELRNELSNLFEGQAGKASAIERHEHRVEWAREHLAEILRWLGLDATGRRWRVDSLVVVDRELITPYLMQSKTRIISFAELKSQVLGS